MTDSPTIDWITAFLDLPTATAAAGTAFWQAVTGSSLSARRGSHAQFVTLVPPAGDATLRVQTVPGPRPRVHLDLHTDHPERLVRAATAADAQVVHVQDDLTVLRSPGGFVLCVVGWDGEKVPPAALGRPGTRSAVDQVCLDAPPAVAAAELTFWTQLTGWPVRSGRLPEFHRIEVPDRLPIRLLFQRLADPAPAVTGHLDLAVEDRAHETARHVALGAELRSRHEFWTVLSDPTGMVYCLTDRPPRPA